MGTERVYEDGRVEVVFPTEFDNAKYGQPVTTTIEKWRAMNEHIEKLARSAGLRNPALHNIDFPTEEIRIIRGMDKDGSPCYATQFSIVGTENGPTSHLMDRFVAHGMLAVGGFEFERRYDEATRPNDD